MHAEPLPLPEIDPAALLRDRTTVDPAALDALKTSIAVEGLRMPIEVWRLTTPRPNPAGGPDHRYGLISGLRRLTACRALGHETIPAFLRTPDSIASAMAAMVSENEHRSPVSPWEKGTLILATLEEGHFDTLDAATAALYPLAARPTRARYRAFSTVVECLAGHLSTPERLSTQRMDRLAAALRTGAEPPLLAALAPLAGEPLEAQWSALLPLLTDTLLRPEDPTTGRPRRFLHLKQGLTIRREKVRDGWILRLTGPEARSGGLVDDVLDKVERLFQPQ